MPRPELSSFLGPELLASLSMPMSTISKPLSAAASTPMIVISEDPTGGTNMASMNAERWKQLTRLDKNHRIMTRRDTDSPIANTSP